MNADALGEQNDLKPKRTFGLKIDGHPTTIEVLEFEDKSIGIAIVTRVDGSEPYISTLRLTEKTLALLSEALRLSAPDSDAWQAP